MNKRINLALQGGGSHGAFTWGVLDKLLECDFIEIAMISGTSAGALNGVALVNGIIEAGPESARVELERIWRRISERGRFSPIQRTPFDRASGNWSLDNSPGFYLVDAITRAYSPYQLNPFNFNPVRQIIEECVDFDRLRSDMRIPLFVSATNVETGQIEVFDHKRLNPDIVVAAGCLP
ncbi:MAG: patatin-like phospholipase family protein, partial [Pseudomonadota bacterium]